MDSTKFSLSVSPQMLDMLRANPGLNFSATDLAKIQNGTLVVAGALAPPRHTSPLKRGCISQLRYQKNGNDLERIVVGGTTYDISQVKNLNDFRDRLQEAANHGHEVSFCFYSRDKKMTMLNIYPCGCKCKCDDCQK